MEYNKYKYNAEPISDLGVEVFSSYLRNFDGYYHFLNNCFTTICSDTGLVAKIGIDYVLHPIRI